jgi:hypothetical protein
VATTVPPNGTKKHLSGFFKHIFCIHVAGTQKRFHFLLDMVISNDLHVQVKNWRLFKQHKIA